MKPKRLLLIISAVVSVMLLPGCVGLHFVRPTPEEEARVGVETTNAAAIQAGVDAVNTANAINNDAAIQAAIPPPQANQ